jgi:hypothetical protein
MEVTMSASKVRSNTQKGGDQDLSLDGFSTSAIMKNCSVVLDATVVSCKIIQLN